MKWLSPITILACGALAVRALAEVVPSEFSFQPVDEGWTLLGQSGELVVGAENGQYFQDFANHCAPGPVCGTEAFTRSAEQFNGETDWFYEYRVAATGSHTEIQAGAPTVLATGNSFGNLYHATLATDRIKLSGDFDLPVLFLDVEPGVPHTIRLELQNGPASATFHWYVDGVVVLDGPADGPFPDFDSRIGFQGRTWMQPTLNAWHYIRFGDISEDASGDFDSENDVDLRDYFYFHECLTNTGPGIYGGPDETAGPGCRWADMDGDSDVDLLDFVQFQTAFTGSD